MSKLPKDRTSVVTILRDPVDRVFSTYEFSVEVAARFLVHPNLTSATRMAARLRSKNKGVTVSTLDIWPWKYLVPWMREDLFARVCLLYYMMLVFSPLLYFFPVLMTIGYSWPTDFCWSVLLILRHAAKNQSDVQRNGKVHICCRWRRMIHLFV